MHCRQAGTCTHTHTHTGKKPGAQKLLYRDAQRSDCDVAYSAMSPFIRMGIRVSKQHI